MAKARKGTGARKKATARPARRAPDHGRPDVADIQVAWFVIDRSGEVPLARVQKTLMGLAAAVLQASGVSPDRIAIRVAQATTRLVYEPDQLNLFETNLEAQRR